MGNKKKHHQEKRERPEEAPEAEETKQEGEEGRQKGEGGLEAKKVPYCPSCTLPFELCRYGKDAIECAAWLFKKAPGKVTKYHPDFKAELLERREGEGEAERARGKEEGRARSVREKYVAIEVKNRGKKHFITTVEGLNNFGIDAKEVSKKCSKKFAVSCSVAGTGSIRMQGDNFEAMRDFLLAEHKQLKKKYVIDKEELNAKLAEERARKKEQRQRDKQAIKEEPDEEEEQGEKKEEEQPDRNALRFQAMAQLEAGSEDDDE